MRDEDSILTMSFDPSTIEHLGIRMYSTLPPVMAELIANAYDADAKQVKIELFDNQDEKTIVVTDDGEGMSLSEINSDFLRIGRNRRNEQSSITKLGRKVIGKKGLGKLSYFGLSKCIEVETIKNGLKNAFEMDLDAILSSPDQVYHPTILLQNKPTQEPSGTKITLHQVKRKTGFSAEKLAIALSRYFFIDRDFAIQVCHNNSSYLVSEKLRTEGVNKQFVWNIPDEAPKDSRDFFVKNEIVGILLTAEKPLPPDMRGVTLYSRGKLVNLPSSFVEGSSSHFYSYLTGYLDISYLDDLSVDLVSTNRQSLNWDSAETIELNSYLVSLVKSIEKSWREKRKKEKEKETKDSTGIDIDSWLQNNPAEIQHILEPLISQIINTAETKGSTAAKLINGVHQLVPEYATYHWRSLHEEVQDVSRVYYENQDYYTAVFESAKRYVSKVKKKSGTTLEKEIDILNHVFQERNPLLKVALGYAKSDGSSFKSDTLLSIERGNKGLAIGAWQGFRNPIGHEEAQELSQSGLFSETDCLDALSLLSHLFRRLDNAQCIKE